MCGAELCLAAVTTPPPLGEVGGGCQPASQLFQSSMYQYGSRGFLHTMIFSFTAQPSWGGVQAEPASPDFPAPAQPPPPPGCLSKALVWRFHYKMLDCDAFAAICRTSKQGDDVYEWIASIGKQSVPAMESGRSSTTTFKLITVDIFGNCRAGSEGAHLLPHHRSIHYNNCQMGVFPC
jgi:hypothetical protein